MNLCSTFRTWKHDTFFCAQKLLSLQEVHLKFSTNVVFRMLTAFFDKDGEENPQFYAVLNKLFRRISIGVP